MPRRRAGGGVSHPPDPSVTRIDGPWRHLQVHANGIRFHVVEAHGTEPEGRRPAGTAATDRPLVILLHGFGSFWWSWRHQLRGLGAPPVGERSDGIRPVGERSDGIRPVGERSDGIRPRVVAVDLRGYGGTDKPPRGYDGWTLAGDTAGLVRALGHQSATLVGHADGGLVCWATSVLHPRVVRAIALISSPHPLALRASALTSRDQGLALLPWLLRYQLPIWPERVLTRNDAAELERLVRSRAGAKWIASEDFADTMQQLRRVIQIPSAAHCALEYQRWAVRSQFRREGHRFTSAMKRPLTVPALHLRGDADPYVLADPVSRTRTFAPHARYVSITEAGHFCHEEAPDEVNAHLTRFLAQVYRPVS
jgi:pimeloyl-ACP methyl ester carboxylesterase